MDFVACEAKVVSRAEAAADRCGLAGGTRQAALVPAADNELLHLTGACQQRSTLPLPLLLLLPLMIMPDRCAPANQATAALFLPPSTAADAGVRSGGGYRARATGAVGRSAAAAAYRCCGGGGRCWR